MNRNVVKALIRLFALVSGDGRTSRYGRPVVEQFLLRLVSKDQLEEYLGIFDELAASPDEIIDTEREKSAEPCHLLRF
jgi:hypothetical protein